ncbi:MAG: exosortase/archaeosortase family protein [Candidatus Nanohaloarchaea archaeon]
MFTERQEKYARTLAFLSKLLIAGAVFHLILFIYPDTYSLQSALARQVNALLSWTGLDFHRRGIYLISDTAKYYITQDCLGWKSMSMYTALVFASSTRFRKHLKELFTGLIVIYIANLVRVTSTIYLSYKGVISFEVIHGFLWKWGLTAVVMILWMAWYRKLEEEEDSRIYIYLEKLLSKLQSE